MELSVHEIIRKAGGASSKVSGNNAAEITCEESCNHHN